MDTVTNRLTEIVTAAFRDCGFIGEMSFGNVTKSNRPDICDYQCNDAFKCASLYKRNPLDIANCIANKISTNSAFSYVDVAAPGYINIKLSDNQLCESIREMIDEPNWGIPAIKHKEIIVLDYGGPNIAKPLHIGHLRSAIIGEALKRLMRYMGYTVISDVHLGDWGLQMGLVMAELSERQPGFSCFTSEYNVGDELPYIEVEDLCEIYPLASKRGKADRVFLEKAHDFTRKLQNGDQGLVALWKFIWEISIDDLKRNYANLGVSFDLWYGESDAQPYIDEVIKLLNNTKILQEDQGAQIVPVAMESDNKKIPPAIIIKSDGAVNYETTDIATVFQRQQDFQPDRIWYVVDKRQEMHFLQVFRVVRQARIVPEKTELLHLGFGTMNGEDGKPFKTRDGGVMRLSDMITAVTDTALNKVSSSNYATFEERQETARKIGIAAIKFGDLVNHRTTDYVFDIEKFLAFEGKTGTYILYTVTRINSLLEKANTELLKPHIENVFSKSERNLMLKLCEVGDMFSIAVNEKAPNYICESAYQISCAFSQFYHENHILYEKDSLKRESWLSLCIIVRSILILHLDILGIDCVDFM